MGQQQIGDVAQAAPVPLRDRFSPLDRGREVPQLHVEKCRLEVIEQTGESMAVVLPGLAIFPVVPHSPGKNRHLGIVGGDGPSIPVTAQYLERVETPAAGQAPGTRHPAVDRAAETLTGVFDHNDPMFFRDLQDAGHIGHVAAQVHGDDRPRFRSDRHFNLFRVDIEIFPNVDENRCRVDVDDGGTGRHEGMRRDDDLVPCGDSGGPQRHVEGIVTAVQTNGIFRPDIPGQVLLECAKMASVDQFPSRHDIEVGRIELVLHHPIDFRRFHETDFSHPSPSTRKIPDPSHDRGKDHLIQEPRSVCRQNGSKTASARSIRRS